MAVSFQQAPRPSYRRLSTVVAACLLCAAPAFALHGETHAPAPEAGALTFREAQQLALQHRQPLLEATRADARAGDALAIADARLPDPQLTLGIEDLPAEGSDAWRADAPEAALMVGVMQEFPLPGKRRAQANATAALAGAGQAEAQAQARDIRRAVALAWIDLAEADAMARLFDALVGEEDLAREAALAAQRNGRAAQADVLAATVARERVADQAAGWRQQRERARARLARWIGDAAQRPLPAGLTEPVAPPAREQLLAALDGHPALRAQQARAQAAQADVALAEADYLPDWRLGVRYGYRELYDDMVSLEVGMDLPLFTRQRQGQRATAARERLLAADAQRDDLRLALQAELDEALADAQALAQRLPFHERAILAPAAARVDAMLAAYRAGSAGIADLVAARREHLDMDAMHIAMLADALRAQARLDWFTAEEQP